MHSWSITGALRVAGIAAVLGTAMPIQIGTSTRAASAAGIGRCSSAQVEIRPTNRGLGAALGHVGRWYRIRSVRGEPCRLQGFPTIELLDRGFNTLSTPVKHGQGYIITAAVPIRRVTVRRQHDGYFALEYMDVPSDDHPCQAVRYLRVTLPSDTLPVVIRSGAITPCPGEVGVSPVEQRPALR